MSTGGEGKYIIPQLRSVKTRSTMSQTNLTTSTPNTPLRTFDHPKLPESSYNMFTQTQLENIRLPCVQDIIREENYSGTPEDKPFVGESGDTKHTQLSLEHIKWTRVQNSHFGKFWW
eukprot:GHVR01136465.1.p1 GENE.GHVR01136465.1~~GHVR01136465.1.p1  ORF type:complete len:117 (+),score=12.37 GHVR01136465.1:701-1051(+)